MRHPVRAAGGTTAHVKAFEAIAINERPRCRQATLDWLVDHGMVNRAWRCVGRDAFGPVMASSYECTLIYHMAWCDWCAAQPETSGT